MECFRCQERYTEETRRPKLLPCGHTFCLPCLQEARECFSDGKAFPGADSLPDDAYTLGLVTGDIRRHPDDPVPGELQLWCRGCAASASDACVDGGHELVTRRQRWHEQVLQGLEALAAALESTEQTELPDAELERLVGAAGVKVTLLEDGDAAGDQWTSTVQLGGSGEEGTDESWALRDLLLLALRGHDDEEEQVVETPADTLQILDLGNGLFDEPQRKGPSGSPDFGLGLFDDYSGDDDDGGDDARDAGMAALEAEAPGEYTAEAAEALAQDKLKEVLKITELNCASDPVGRQLQLLKQVSPHLEELRVTNLRREHLMAIQRMPRLRRLEVTAAKMWDDPFQVPAALEHDGGLEYLKVCLCPPTAASLIYAHNRTLRHVQIVPPARGRRDARYGHSTYFERLDYLGSGRVGEHVLRSPFFPRREPGDFPVLERVEFVDVPRDPHVMNPSWIMGRDLDMVERQLSGVHVEMLFRKKPF